MLRAEVASLVPEMRLMLATNLGSTITLAACLTSWLTGEDPLGGFALTNDSLSAMAAGAGYAVPLLLCSVASRLGAVRQRFPVLRDLHDNQAEIVRPIVEDLDPSQLLILSSVLVVPAMLLLLPAAHGMMTMAGALLAADLVSPSLELAGGPVHAAATAAAAAGGVDLGPAALPLTLHWHWHMPELLRRNAVALGTAVCSAYFAAWLVTRQLDVKDRQVLLIRDALESADRYFLHAAAERAAAQPELLLLLQDRCGAPAPAGRREQPQRPRAAEGPDGLAATSFASSAGDAAPASGAPADECGRGAASVSLRQLGAEMAQAFKTVSLLWMLTRRRAARLGYVLTALNVSYFGIIWHHTRDLGAPVTAALLATLAELLLTKHFPSGQSRA